MKSMRAAVLFAFAAVIAAGGCQTDSALTATNEDPLAEGEALSLLEAVSEEEHARLPALAPLLRQLRAAIRESGGHPEGEALLRQSRQLRVQASEARRAGDRDAARRLASEARDTLLQAIVVVLGRETALRAVAGVETAFDRLAERLGDRVLPPVFQRRVDRLESLVSEARRALRTDDPVRALDLSLRAAAAFRALSPDAMAARAEAAVERAAGLLARAQAAAGEDASERVIRAVARAEALLERAEAALVEGRPRAALAAAVGSGRLSQRVIRHLTGR